MPTTDMAAPGASRAPPACDYSGSRDRVRARDRLLTRLSPTAEHRPPTGSYSPLRRRAVPAGGESARRRLRLRHFPEGLGPRWLRAVRVRERSGKGGSRRYLERHPALHVRTAEGHAPAPLKGAARPKRRPSPGGLGRCWCCCGVQCKTLLRALAYHFN